MPEHDDEPSVLRLCFLAVADAVPGLGVDHYVASVRDDAGLAVFELRLPAAQVESVVVNHITPTIAMSLDGTIAVVDDQREGSLRAGDEVSVDALIRRSIAPEMLEDEPDASAMLALLRDRLRTALRDVEAAIDRL
ncbi:MAG: hypothetical protein ACKVP5_22205 [Aestuariivirga sp.]